MAITAADVKKLRDATGAGMMDAKKALVEADGDFDAAVDILRVAGQAKVSKRAGREATNGLVAAVDKTLVQVATETDFVAKNAEFIALAQEIAAAAAAVRAEDVDAAKAAPIALAQSAAEALDGFAAKIGEKMEIKAAATFSGDTAIYLHRRSQDLPPQVGVMVEYEGGDPDFARGLCMQIAAMSPAWVSRDEVPADVVAHEAKLAELAAREEGKPDKIIPRIVEGRLNGFYAEMCLVEQMSVSDDKKTVGQLLKERGVTVKRFVRFAAGA